MAVVKRCQVCGVSLKAENEQVHMGKAHPRVQTRCEVCGVWLRRDNISSHMKNVHPKEAVGKFSSLRTPHKARMSTRAFVFLLVLVGILALAGWMLLRNAGRTAPIEPEAQQLTISMGGFTPSTLTTSVGKPLRIDLINQDNAYHPDGGGRHNFVVEGLGVSVTVEPLGQAVLTLPADQAGTYTYYCDICCGGRSNPAMVGIFIVTA